MDGRWMDGWMDGWWMLVPGLVLGPVVEANFLYKRIPLAPVASRAGPLCKRLGREAEARRIRLFTALVMV